MAATRRTESATRDGRRLPRMSQALYGWPLWLKMLHAVIAVALGTVALWAVRLEAEPRHATILYIFIVGGVAYLFGAASALVAGVLSFLALDVLFLEPVGGILPRHTGDLAVLLAFLVVAATQGLLTVRLQKREKDAISHVRRASSAQALAAQLVEHAVEIASPGGPLDIIREEARASRVCLYATREADNPEHVRLEAGDDEPDVLPVVRHVVRTGEPVGSTALSASPLSHVAEWPRFAPPPASVGAAYRPGDVYLPLRTRSGVEGVLHLVPESGRAFEPDDLRLAVFGSRLLAAVLERTRLEAQRASAQAEAAASQHMSTFLASVTHELKTPLAVLRTIVSGWSERDTELQADRVREDVATLEEALDRLETSITHLLDLSRLQTASWKPRTDVCEVGDVLAQVLVSAPSRARARVTVQSTGESALLECDQRQLSRALGVLVQNALDYSPPDSPVVVGCTASSDWIEFWVEDRGEGVAEDEREAIFEPFVRGRQAYLQPSGTGIGLAIAREIARVHGGTIHVTDVQPKGARFTLSVPSVKGTAALCEEM